MEKAKKRKQKWRDKQYEMGNCIQCGKERDNETQTCQQCREKKSVSNKKTRLKYKRNGQCTGCGGKPLAMGSKCLKCWYVSVSNQRKVPIEILKSIPIGNCPYFGVKLIPGFNISLDHIVPVSRGGGNDRDNLQWVSQVANEMKGEWTHSEFIELAKEISEANK